MNTKAQVVLMMPCPSGPRFLDPHSSLLIDGTGFRVNCPTLNAPQLLSLRPVTFLCGQCSTSTTSFLVNSWGGRKRNSQIIIKGQSDTVLVLGFKWTLAMRKSTFLEVGKIYFSLWGLCLLGKNLRGPRRKRTQSKPGESEEEAGCLQQEDLKETRHGTRHAVEHIQNTRQPRSGVMNNLCEAGTWAWRGAGNCCSLSFLCKR